MRQIIILFLVTIFCKAQDNPDAIFKTIEDDNSFNYKFKKLIKKNTDTIAVLRTEYSKKILTNYQGKIVVKDSEYFLNTQNRFVLDIVKCIVNIDLAYVAFTVGSHSSIEVYLIKSDDQWFVKEVLSRKMIQLKKSLAKDLSIKVQNEVLKDIDKNIELVNLHMTEKEIVNILGNNFLSIKDTMNKKMYSYSSFKSDFVIHQIIFDSIGKVEKIKKYIDTMNW